MHLRRQCFNLKATSLAAGEERTEPIDTLVFKYVLNPAVNKQAQDSLESTVVDSRAGEPRRGRGNRRWRAEGSSERDDTPTERGKRPRRCDSDKPLFPHILLREMAIVSAVSLHTSAFVAHGVGCTDISTAFWRRRDISPTSSQQWDHLCLPKDFDWRTHLVTWHLIQRSGMVYKAKPL